MKTLFAALATTLLALTAWAADAQNVSRMSIDELKAVLGKTDLVVIDVRSPRDWEATSSKILGAVREDPGGASTWARKYPKEKTLVLYCA
jgi:rhodanese-related sulfurtransferase